jgi:Leucine-rich repeat (LRR) protein
LSPIVTPGRRVDTFRWLGVDPRWHTRLVSRTDLRRIGEGLTEVPAELRGRRDLDRLDLSNNALRALPDWIAEWDGLRVLRVGRNPLTRVPASLFTMALAELALDGTALTSIPAELGQMHTLVHLVLGHNPLREPPPASLGALTALEVLDLSAAPLGELPTWLRGLHRLTTLTVQRCGLRDLPDWLTELPALRTVTAVGNEIDEERGYQLEEQQPRLMIVL